MAGVQVDRTNGLGGDHNPSGLALAWRGVNGRKEVFFHGNSPSSDNAETNLQTRVSHRNTAAVFSYMRNDLIWPKFTALSQFMERTLRKFDQSYAWGSESDEPARPPNRGNDQPAPGLRDLYCFWIDRHLGQIEATADIWYNAARAKYQGKYGSDNKGIDWPNNVLTPAGAIGPASLRFPAARNKHGQPNPQNPQ